MHTIDLQPIQNTLGFALWQTTNHWQKAMADALRPLDLTYVQVMLLAGVTQLSQQDKVVTQNSVAHYTQADVMMTSKVCRTLEKKGLLLRANSRFDSRAKTLVVTKLGSSLLQEALVLVRTVDEVFFSAAAKDAEKLAKILSALRSSESGVEL